MGQQQSLQCARYVTERTKGETPILRSHAIPDGEDLISEFKGMSNLRDIFKYQLFRQSENRHVAEESGNKDFLGTREKKKGEDGKTEFGQYKWKTFKETYQDSEALAKYLMHHELCPKESFDEGEFRFVALYSKNREEWTITDFGCMLGGITTVTLYDTLGKESIEYIIEQVRTKVCFLQGDKIKNIVQLKKDGKIKCLTHVISFDEVSEDQLDQAKQADVKVILFKDAIKEGKNLEAKLDDVSKDTIYTLCYTSGTTGKPKGVMLTHGNFVANIGGMNHYDNEFKFYDDDSYISYLPLAHVFERFFMVACMCSAVKYGFYQGEVTKLKDDLQELKPTLMCSVPRLYNKFYDVIQDKVGSAPFYQRAIAQWGISSKMSSLESSGQAWSRVYDPIVFNKFKQTLGGRVRRMICGSAPISQEVLNYLKVCFCVDINIGYGQTETAAAASLSWANDPQGGHVGAPYPSCEFKLVDLPEMKYTSLDEDEDGNPMPRGEIWIRGYNVFKGYFQMPKETKEVLTEDGWLKTGDIGQITPNGCIKIIDRKKNIFKLSQGEYIIPDKVENILSENKYVHQIFVYGDSYQSFLVAIVVPDKKPFKELAQEHGIKYDDYDDLITNKDIIKILKEELKKQGRQGGLNGLEIPHEIHLTQNEFTVENDILTPSFKIKRNEAKQYFLSEIKDLYGGAKLQGEH